MNKTAYQCDNCSRFFQVAESLTIVNIGNIISNSITYRSVWSFDYKAFCDECLKIREITWE